jgi:hypothetical protein
MNRRSRLLTHETPEPESNPIKQAAALFIETTIPIRQIREAMRSLDRLAALDMKIKPHEGEDETRMFLEYPEGSLPDTQPVRFLRSFARRWARACGYDVKNVITAAAGKKLSDREKCPRLAHGKELVARCKPEARAKATVLRKAWRQAPEVRARVNSSSRGWKLRNIDKDKELDRAYQLRRDVLDYHRPFIAVDSEGMDYPGRDIIKDGVTRSDHGTFLWGAGGVKHDRATDGWQDLEITWLGHDDKRMLSGEEILDFLLALPDIYGHANFIMFAMNYDATQLLKVLPGGERRRYETVYEITKNIVFKTKRKTLAGTYIAEYSISYIKGKRLVLKKIERVNGSMKTLRTITIYDAWGFYQSPFVKVIESLVPLGLATPQEVESIKRDKARRSSFDEIENVSEIKSYTTLELRKLSTAVTVLRDQCFDKLGIRLNSWMGAGAAASALMRKEGVAQHYSGRVSKFDPTEEQEIAHASFYGARIEATKMGLHDSPEPVFQYDINSSYPANCLSLPSMIGGEFEKGEFREWENVENACPLSMFYVQWSLPLAYVDTRGNIKYVPMYPLPYRLPGGGILYPHRGSGWYVRDDVIAAKRWCETFSRLGAAISPEGMPVPITAKAGRALRLDAQARKIGFILRPSRACLFHPASDAKPFEFIRKIYEERRAIKRRIKKTRVYDIAEKGHKLPINAIYGKLAQSIGGGQGTPPVTACPWYASAITAATRRAVLEAALQAPHEIVQFMTDGIHSLTPLHLPFSGRYRTMGCKRSSSFTLRSKRRLFQ